jgi:ribosome recycling factor
MSTDQIMRELTGKFSEKEIWFKTELSKLRSGRVNTALVENLSIDAYGSQMPLNQLATISTPDPKCISIQPWDKTQLEAIEKSILKADVGVTPTNDGDVIRLNFPPLSEERRLELVKVVKKLAEETKVALRTCRRESLNAIQALKKEMPEDDIKKGEEKIQKELALFEKRISDLTENKSSELMTL